MIVSARFFKYLISAINAYVLFLPFTILGQVAEPHMLSLQVLGGNMPDQIIPYTSKTPDGGFIISLSTSSLSGPIASAFCTSTSSRTIFIKYDEDGSTQQWFKCRASSWVDTGYIFMSQTIDDKYVLGGTANHGNKWVIRKEDALGNVLWTKAYGGSGSQMLYSMTATNDGGYILFGSAYGGDGDIGFHYGGAFTRDFWVLKVNADGEKVWSKVYGGTEEDLGASVLPAPSNGYYIVGSTVSSDYECADNHGSADVFIARLNADGDILWRRCLGGSNADGGGEIKGCRATSDGKGGVLITARTSSNDGDVSHKINSPGDNIWLINIDSANNIMWDNCYGGGGAEYPNNICKATDGSIWIIGDSHFSGGQVNDAFGGSTDAYVVHTDSVGNFLNAKVIGSSGQDVGYLIYPLSNGLVLGGGCYAKADGSFNTFQGGQADGFLVILTNWTNDIKHVSAKKSVSIYPNPAKEIVSINCDNTSGSITIHDVTGRIVYSDKILNSIHLSLVGWTSGMYYVQISEEGEAKMVHKLTVQ